MKVAELVKYILNFGINQAENYPEQWSSYDVLHGLNVIDKVVEHLDYNYSFEEVIDSRELDLSPEEWADLLDEYSLGQASALDCLIENLRDGTF